MYDIWNKACNLSFKILVENSDKNIRKETVKMATNAVLSSNLDN